MGVQKRWICRQRKVDGEGLEDGKSKMEAGVE